MKLIFYIFFFSTDVLISFSQNIRDAAVTLIVDTDNNIKEIICPKYILGERSDFIQNNGVVSFIKASFYCDIILINNALTSEPSYHISVRPLFSASRIGCKSFDSCYNLDITQIKATNFRFNIEGSVPCLEEILKFLFKLQKQHEVVHTTVTELFVGKKPPSPSNLTYQFINNTVTLLGDLKSICENVFHVSSYYATFSFSSSLNHLVTKTKTCNILRNVNSYQLQCRIFNLTEYVFNEKQLCDFTLLTNVIGVNKNVTGNMKHSIYFSSIESMNSSNIVIRKQSFTSLLLSFQQDQLCTRKRRINLVVHVKGVENDVNDLFTKGCQNFDSCQINLRNLLPGSQYNVCIYQQEVFQNMFGKSKKVCRIVSTLRFPCVKSHIVNITKEVVSVQYWKAIVYMKKQCNDPVVFSVIQVIENNDTIVFNKTFLFNMYYKSKGTIKNLDFSKQYNLKIMSCNVYKCRDNIEEIYLLPPVLNTDSIPEEDKRKSETTPILNLILITVSLLVLAIVIVYLIHFLCHRNDKQITQVHRDDDSIPENSTLV